MRLTRPLRITCRHSSSACSSQTRIGHQHQPACALLLRFAGIGRVDPAQRQQRVTTGVDHIGIQLVAHLQRPGVDQHPLAAVGRCQRQDQPLPGEDRLAALGGMDRVDRLATLQRLGLQRAQQRGTLRPELRQPRASAIDAGMAADLAAVVAVDKVVARPIRGVWRRLTSQQHQPAMQAMPQSVGKGRQRHPPLRIAALAPAVAQHRDVRAAGPRLDVLAHHLVPAARTGLDPLDHCLCLCPLQRPSRSATPWNPPVRAVIFHESNACPK
jgi:hypothetical protein